MLVAGLAWTALAYPSLALAAKPAARAKGSAASLPAPAVLERMPARHMYRACRKAGYGPDGILNRLKNRASLPARYTAMSIDQINQLQMPAGLPNQRRRWSAGEARQVARTERRGAVVEGYITGVNQERFEAGNCYRPDLHDLHLWMGNRPGQSEATALIVEATPRWQGVRKQWRRKVFEKLEHEQVKVRVSGWLMLDQGHRDQIGKTRGGVWEIHPITRVQVWRAGRWRELR